MLSLRQYPSVAKATAVSNTLMEKFVFFLKVHHRFFYLRKLCLMFFFQENSNVDAFIKQKPPHLKQPFILALGTVKNPKQFFLAIDEEIISCGTDFAHAFQVLFASFWVFDYDYPPIVSEWYSFFEFAVFEITTKASNTTFSYLASLDAFASH